MDLLNLVNKEREEREQKESFFMKNIKNSSKNPAPDPAFIEYQAIHQKYLDDIRQIVKERFKEEHNYIQIEAILFRILVMARIKMESSHISSNFLSFLKTDTIRNSISKLLSKMYYSETTTIRSFRRFKN